MAPTQSTPWVTLDLKKEDVHKQKPRRSLNVGVASCSLHLEDWVGMTKPGSPAEKLGAHGGFTHGVTILGGGLPRDVQQPVLIDHGKVIYRSDNLKPDLSYEGETNDIGGRSDERHGRAGSFTHGVETWEGGQLHYPAHRAEDWVEAGQTGARRFTGNHHNAGCTILAGGSPRNVAIYNNAQELNHGQVLYTCQNLKPDLSSEGQVNERGERLGSRGSFTPGPGLRHMMYPAKNTPALWQESGQTGARRFTGNHHNAGITINRGGRSCYRPLPTTYPVSAF